MGSYRYRRAVRFDEVDAAGFVFFARIAALPHEALERWLDAAEHGLYARCLLQHRVGLPCVHLEADFRAPLRFGDEIAVEMRVDRFGETSVSFSIAIARGDGQICATISYVVACAALDGPTKQPLPHAL